MRRADTTLQLLSRANEVKILVIGDLMLDRFLYGSVDRISPEAPIPVFLHEREERMLGGAGNVVRNLLSLGASASFISVIGDDAVGKQLLALVGEQPRLVPYLFTEKDRISTHKTRYVASGQQLLRADHETASSLTANVEQEILKLIASEVGHHHAVILSDYGKGVLSPEIVTAAIAAARAANVPILVDPKRRDLSLYRGATLISPNAREFLLATGRDTFEEATAQQDTATLIHDLALDALLVTRGRARRPF
jgi:D-beta-D-heptose 7-phosphate kinase / D-beta-D-heptose 1-phosphate adenosyltransferase